MGPVSAVGRRRQHAHQRGDPDTAGDQQQRLPSGGRIPGELTVRAGHPQRQPRLELRVQGGGAETIRLVLHGDVDEADLFRTTADRVGIVRSARRATGRSSFTYCPAANENGIVPESRGSRRIRRVVESAPRPPPPAGNPARQWSGFEASRRSGWCATWRRAVAV